MSPLASACPQGGDQSFASCESCLTTATVRIPSAASAANMTAESDRHAKYHAFLQPIKYELCTIATVCR